VGASSVALVKPCRPGLSSTAAITGRREGFDSITLNIGLFIAFDLHQGEEIGNTGHRMALKEVFSGDTVRRTHEGAWFYQGSELWELSLVDPDNRRPVDYRPGLIRSRVVKGLCWRPSWETWTLGKPSSG
jgi:hypothetical protein